MNGYEDFINNLESYIDEKPRKKPWVEKDEYEVRLLDVEDKLSQKGHRMLVLKFREESTGWLFNEYINYGHSNPKVVQIAAGKMSEFCRAAGVSKSVKLSLLISMNFKVKIKHEVNDAGNMNLSITKFIRRVELNRDELPF